MPLSCAPARDQSLVRFERAGRGMRGRWPSPATGMAIHCLPDGRWFDPREETWRDRRGREACWPDLDELTKPDGRRASFSVAAHLDHDQGRTSRQRNLRSVCERCHLAQRQGVGIWCNDGSHLPAALRPRRAGARSRVGPRRLPAVRRVWRTRSGLQRSTEGPTFEAAEGVGFHEKVAYSGCCSGGF